MTTWRAFYTAMRDYILSVPTNLLRLGEPDTPNPTRAQSLLEAHAQQLEELSFEADTEYQNLYAPTSSGLRLTARARELGLERKPAQKATGWAVFTGIAGTVIPEGTRVATGDPDADDNVVQYATTAQQQIAQGETSVAAQVEAAETGPEANVPAGTIDTMIDEVGGIDSVTNLAPISGGADLETDDDLRNRCTLAPYRQSRGIERYWEDLACDVTGIARAKCLSSVPAPGSFKIYAWSRDAEGRLIAADTPLQETLQDYLEQYALACVTLTAATPPGPMQDVTAYLDVADGHTHEEIAPAVAIALQAVFSGLTAGKKLTRAALIAAAMSVQYVTNFRVAVPADDVDPAETETIVSGLIQVLPMEWDGAYL